MAKYRLEHGTGDELRSHRLTAGVKITIGRSSDNTVVLSSPRVSGHHAEVQVLGDRLLLRDVGSKNGTFVNGSFVEKDREVEAGDQIEIGGVEVRIHAVAGPGDNSVTFVGETGEAHQVFASIDAGAPVPGVERAPTGPVSRAARNLAILHAMGEILLESGGEEDLAERILDLVFDVLPADSACVIFAKPDDEPVLGATRSRKGAPDKLEISETILRRSLGEGVSLLTADASKDERFQEGRSVIVQGIHAAMCAPLRGRTEALGAIYVDTRLRRGVFSPEDLELLTTLGIQGGIAVENLRLVQRNLNAERLATMGGVMGGLSHDIRNIVTALRGGAYLMDKVVAKSDDETLKAAWEAIRLSSDTIARLVEDMVSYSKEREPEKIATNLNELVRLVAERFRDQAGECGTVIRVDYDEGLPLVDVDPAAIDRVLTNLVANALDAVGEGGEVRLATGPAPGPQQAEITVADNGPGIPPEDLERIFDLLYSTKGSKGTGFGLAIAEKIVSEHEGALLVESEPGAGATFRMRL